MLEENCRVNLRPSLQRWVLTSMVGTPLRVLLFDRPRRMSSASGCWTRTRSWTDRTTPSRTRGAPWRRPPRSRWRLRGSSRGTGRRSSRRPPRYGMLPVWDAQRVMVLLGFEILGGGGGHLCACLFLLVRRISVLVHGLALILGSLRIPFAGVYVPWGHGPRGQDRD